MTFVSMIWTHHNLSTEFAMGYPWHCVVRHGTVAAWLIAPGSYMNDLYENWRLCILPTKCMFGGGGARGGPNLITEHYLFRRT